MRPWRVAVGYVVASALAAALVLMPLVPLAGSLTSATAEIQKRLLYGVGGALGMLILLGAAVAWLLARRAAALRSSEERYTLALEAAEEGHFDNDLESGEIFVSARVNEIYGLPRQARTLNRMEFLRQIPLHPDDRHVLDELSKPDWRAPGDFYEIECRVVPRSGETRWIHSRAKVVRDAAGRPRRRVGVVADITERKRAEEALRESERESHLIVHTIPGLVAVLAPSGEVGFVNKGLIDYCGQQLEAMKQWGTNGTVHAEDLPHVTGEFALAIATGEPYDFEARIRRFDGAYRWFQVRGLPLRDSSGQIVRWYVLLSDVDERKRAESELRRAHERFADAQRVAAMSTLTASIAHEVNQPLSGIITNASTCVRMLDADPPNVDGARETARRTIRDGHRASDVIARLRALFSKKDLALESLDLNEAIREVIALSLNDFHGNRVVLEQELAEDLPSVTGDRIQLQQVTLNLIRNACEAMAGVNDRPRQLVIGTGRDDGDRVRVTVRDSGVGLDPLSMDKLFDAFYTTKSGGMGVGLSVSRSIVERHQGWLWAEPNDGPGATFSFSVPITPPRD